MIPNRFGCITSYIYKPISQFFFHASPRLVRSCLRLLRLRSAQVVWRQEWDQWNNLNEPTKTCALLEPQNRCLNKSNLSIFKLFK